MARKKNRTEYHILTVTGWAGEGHGVGRLSDGRVVFVPWALPGDEVEVACLRTKKNFLQGRVVRLIQPSPQRQEAPCRHFGQCGGCTLQHASYTYQLQLKQQHLEGLLRHLGCFPAPPVEAPLACPEPWGYRNKLDFAFSKRRWLPAEQLGNPDIPAAPGCGFHVAGHFDKVLHIEKCLLQPEINDQLRKAFHEAAQKRGISYYNARTGQGMLRGLILRCNRRGDWMVVLVVNAGGASIAEELLASVAEDFPSVVSWFYIVNSKTNDSLHDLVPVLWKGQPWLEESLAGLHFRIHPKSFFQTNPSQAERLYLLAREMAETGPETRLLDLYCGTGTTTAILGRNARQALGVDVVPEAIEDARYNALRNGLHHVEFICEDSARILTSDHVDRWGFPDVLVTDPPRAGMTPTVCQEILRLRPQRMVYISCNPATLIRDLNHLSEAYEVRRIQPVDMFPHTRHLECVVLLTLKPH